MRAQKGSALIIALLAVVTIAILAAILPSMFNQNLKAIRALSARTAALTVKENVMAVIDNDAAWVATLNNPTNNGALRCLKINGAVCTAANFQTLEINESDGAPFIQNGANRGFKFDGTPCSTFKAGGITDDCVYKYTITWDCGPGPCKPTKLQAGNPIALEPSVHIKGAFEFSPKENSLAGMVANDPTGPLGGPSTYHIDFTRGSQSKTLSKFCNSIDGIFDQQTKECESNLGVKGFDCTTILGPQSWFAGFNPDGSPNCIWDPKVNKSCPPGTAVRGYAADGGLVCGGF
jgi:hypothetical protein